jgi:hypothetical protein
MVTCFVSDRNAPVEWDQLECPAAQTSDDNYQLCFGHKFFACTYTFRTESSFSPQGSYADALGSNCFSFPVRQYRAALAVFQVARGSSSGLFPRGVTVSSSYSL